MCDEEVIVGDEVVVREPEPEARPMSVEKKRRTRRSETDANLRSLALVLLALGELLEVDTGMLAQMRELVRRTQ